MRFLLVLRAVVQFQFGIAQCVLSAHWETLRALGTSCGTTGDAAVGSIAAKFSRMLPPQLREGPRRIFEYALRSAGEKSGTMREPVLGSERRHAR